MDHIYIFPIFNSFLINFDNIPNKEKLLLIFYVPHVSQDFLIDIRNSTG